VLHFRMIPKQRAQKARMHDADQAGGWSGGKICWEREERHMIEHVAPADKQRGYMFQTGTSYVSSFL
jgi:hypothetical protein